LKNFTLPDIVVITSNENGTEMFINEHS